MQQKIDLLVVGAGVLGAFHAYHAARQGLRTLLLEKDVAPKGATVRNFGQVVPSGMAPGRWQRYGIESTRIYKDLQNEIDLSVRQNGSVYLASDEQECRLLEELHARNETIGYPCKLLSQEDCLKRYPGLRASYVRGGLFFPEEVSVEPRLMISRLIDYLVERNDLIYRPQTLVVNCEVDGDACVVTDAQGRRYHAEQVVICNGSHFKTLFPELFSSSDIEVTKLQMLETVPLNGFTLPGSVLTGLSIRRYESFRACPSFDQLDASHLDPRLKDWGIHLLFKQAVDGSVIIGDSHEYRDVRLADELGFDIDHEINRLILQEAQRIFELPTWELRRTWYGTYAQRKSGDLFQHTIDGRIHIVTAIGGKGMTGGPGFAKAHVERLFGLNVAPVS
ncbi:MAG: TIGR03364 family FAD-dependent oxidoreductase [Rhodothermales bacterium]